VIQGGKRGKKRGEGEEKAVLQIGWHGGGKGLNPFIHNFYFLKKKKRDGLIWRMGSLRKERDTVHNSIGLLEKEKGREEDKTTDRERKGGEIRVAGYEKNLFLTHYFL